jgi:hypothetical protein
MEGWEELCLAAIGANENLVKQIDHALKEVAKNIVDPNTDVKEKRAVKIKIEFQPTDDRRSASIKYKVDAKLAGDAPGADHVSFGQDGTGFVAMADQLPLAGLGVVEDENGQRKVVENGGE